MNWMPDLHEGIPVFRQIARHFEEQILSGQLSPGAALPAQRDLALKLNVNRSTVTAAYDELRSRGLLKSVQGSGTRVSESLWGVSVQPIPSWHEYIDGGMFRPTLPLVRRIREVSLDPHVINLARGELSTDLFPTTQLTEVMHNMELTNALGYSDPRGLPSLGQTLANHVHEQHGIRVTPSEVLITSGAQQALHLITSCLVKPGDAIALESPSYSYSLSLFTSAGLRLYPIPMDEHGLIPEVIPSLVKKHRIRMVFVNPTFQNPTGTTLSVNRRQELLRLCESYRLPIVEDDPYGALYLDGATLAPPPLAALATRPEQVLYLGSLSKTVAPGLRLGWMIGPRNVIDRLADAKEQMDFGTNIVAQQIAQTFIESGKWHDTITSLRQVLKQRRDVMIAEMEAQLKGHMRWKVPEGGYHIWGQLAVNVRDTDLLESCIRQGVLVGPGGVYGVEGNGVRLTYARATEDEIREGVRRLRLALESLLHSEK